MTNVTFSMCGWLSAFFAARCHHHLSFKVPAPSSTSFPFENIISGLEQDQRIYLLSNPKGKGISRPEQGAGWDCWQLADEVTVRVSRAAKCLNFGFQQMWNRRAQSSPATHWIGDH
jgi:hypothetical protein